MDDQVKANIGNNEKMVEPIYKKHMSEKARDVVIPVRNIRDRSTSLSEIPQLSNL